MDQHSAGLNGGRLNLQGMLTGYPPGIFRVSPGYLTGGGDRVAGSQD